MVLIKTIGLGRKGVSTGMALRRIDTALDIAFGTESWLVEI